ncbi:MAG TPA: hypothetical protein VI168_11430 [Croceibacterium sp.]
MIVRLAPLLLVLAPSPLLAEACESARFEAPEPIADAVRPYVVCGLFSSAEFASKLTGVSPTSVAQGFGRDACAAVREKAALEASHELQAAMPDRTARERYVESVLRDADHFIAVAYSARAIAIDPAAHLAACRTDQTRTSNASDQ